MLLQDVHIKYKFNQHGSKKEDGRWFLPCECCADLCANGFPLLPALPGEARLSRRLILSADPLLGEPVSIGGARTAAELQSQGVLPLHPAGQGT